MKLVALYKQPADTGSFEEAYFNTHLPLLGKVPGLRRTVVTRFSRTLMGEGLFMMAEMYFGDESALRSAMKSPEMAAAGENLNTFAAGLVTLMFADEQEWPVTA
jgi:uncharacterized protein (TIGR02118 family)